MDPAVPVGTLATRSPYEIPSPANLPSMLSGMHFTSGAFSLLLLILTGVASADQQQQPRRRRKEPLQELHAGQGPTPVMIWDSGLLDKAVGFATIYEKGTVPVPVAWMTSIRQAHMRHTAGVRARCPCGSGGVDPPLGKALPSPSSPTAWPLAKCTFPAVQSHRHFFQCPIALHSARLYHQDTSIKKFQGPTLAYVTPW